MLKTIFYFLTLILFLGIVSCSNPDDVAFKEKEKKELLELKKDSIKNSVKSAAQFSDKQGVVGVFDVPEMLTIAKIDSAPMKNISFKMAKNYSVLQEQVAAIDATIDGAYGCIYYNNDANNFVFECVVPINKLPKKQPKQCKIVALEACKMLIYNFYGPYQNLFSSYDLIRRYIVKNNLQQSGPMREFYITDPTLEKDPLKWLTRIMVPVVKGK